MTTRSIRYTKKSALGAGIAGGIAGGVVMYGAMSAIMTQLGMGANCFAIIMGLITGQSYQNALGPGIAAHFLTSIAIGAIFGAVITTRKLEIQGFGKGIGLGIATGVIAYAVIFLPISMTVLPSHMMDLMKMMPMGNMGMPDNGMSSNTMKEQSPMNKNSMQEKSAANEKMKMEEMNKMIMEETQKLFPMILAGSFVSHIAFGAALGLVVTPIVKRSAKNSGR
jgi:hypothetical protein